MKYNRTTLLGIFLGVLLTGCSTLGENFFIRNYEDQTVSIKYTYYENNIDSTGFAFQPNSFVLISETLLSKKVLNQFPYKSHLHFDTLKVKELSLFSYEVEIPAKSSIRIAPTYYINNIESIVINNTDTIRFVPEYINEELAEQGIVTHKQRLVGDSYYILNLKLIEISRILWD